MLLAIILNEWRFPIEIILHVNFYNSETINFGLWNHTSHFLF